MIIVEPCAGLGNRFIALASAYHAARQTGRKMTVIWKQESVLGAPMEELFELPDNVKVEEIKEYGYKAGLFGQIKGNFIKKRYRKKASKFMECDEIMELYNRKSTAGVKELVEANKSVYIKATNPFWNIFETDRAFDFITPKEHILKTRDEVLKKAFGKRIIGVHIRRTDHIEAIENSPLELFTQKMKDEISDFADTYFYLATDDKSVEKELKEIFGYRIITFDDKSLDRNSVSGIKDAYVEMLCLAAGEKIYGSFNSTFSLMSAKFGNIPLEVVKKDA